MAALLWTALSWIQASPASAKGDYCPFDVTGGNIAEDRNTAKDGAYSDAEDICNEACPDFRKAGVNCTIISQGGKNLYECIADGQCDGEGLPGSGN